MAALALLFAVAQPAELRITHAGPEDRPVARIIVHTAGHPPPAAACRAAHCFEAAAPAWTKLAAAAAAAIDAAEPPGPKRLGTFVFELRGHGKSERRLSAGQSAELLGQLARVVEGTELARELDRRSALGR